MVRPLVLTLLGTVLLIVTLGSRPQREPLRLAPPTAAAGQVTLGGNPIREVVPLSSVPAPLAERPAAAIRLHQISGIRSEGEQKVLVFGDESELAVTPYVLDALPHDVRLRLTYER